MSEKKEMNPDSIEKELSENMELPDPEMDEASGGIRLDLPILPNGLAKDRSGSLRLAARVSGSHKF